MVFSKLTRGGLIGILLRWAGRLRFPTLFFLAAAVFVVNLMVPDMVPLADELLMGLGALLLANLKKDSEDLGSTPPRNNRHTQGAITERADNKL